MIIGCIADDFTGASDIASFFAKGGLRTLLVNNIPALDFDPGESVQAVVLALKIRSIDKEDAVNLTIEAYTYLEKLGCRQIYFKYCSTFDSTPQGNIGPVTDVLIEKTGSRYTILCPALPVNGRTVKEGGLYVQGVPLHESSMKDHPVTPMWDFKISKLMETQGQYSCLDLSVTEMNSLQDIEDWISIQRNETDQKPFYIVPEYYEEQHGKIIASLFKNLPLITGGSGLAEHLAALHSADLNPLYTVQETGQDVFPAGTVGRSIIFAGSCSKATREQIKQFVEEGGRSIELNAFALQSNPEFKEKLIREIRDKQFSDILIHTSGNHPTEREVAATGLSQKDISELFETTMADLAELALEAGVTRIIIAGGETSGAITERLGFQSFILSDSVAPGVPVLTPLQNKAVRLVLKSGNFGQPDFFKQALAKTLEAHS
jgi:uncharacterized protein YgbK (DUF1537 family)